MSPGWTRPRAVALLCAICLLACGDDEPVAPPAELPPVEPVTPPPAPLRRLNRTEYNNTVRDLLGPYGVSGRPVDAFPADLKAGPFDNNAALLGVPAPTAEAFLVGAEGLAQAATANLGKLAPCDPMKEQEAACARRFISAFGPRAYRRPLESAEIDGLLATFALGKEARDYRTGIEYVLQHMLQAPAFLYRVELGAGPAPPGGRAPLSPFELASRLSYFLWKSMPDDRLFELAGSGGLDGKAGVAAEARRMLLDPRARAMVADFHVQWLGVDGVDLAERNAQQFPAWAGARPYLRAETAELATHLVFDGAGDLRALLTEPAAFVNEKTAPLYGLTGVTGAALVKRPLDGSVRAGLLTQAGVLAVHAKPVETSPVVRGHFIRDRLLCQPMPDPPPGVNTNLPPLDPMDPDRDRFAEQLANPACLGCHRRMNLIGAVFAPFDAVGQHRPLDSKMRPVPARGEVVDSDIAGPVEGAVELGRRLAESRQVAACVARQWYRYTMGRVEPPEEEVLVTALGEAFSRGGGRVPDLLLELTQTDSFLQR